MSTKLFGIQIKPFFDLQVAGYPFTAEIDTITRFMPSLPFQDAQSYRAS